MQSRPALESRSQAILRSFRDAELLQYICKVVWFRGLRPSHWIRVDGRTLRTITGDLCWQVMTARSTWSLGLSSGTLSAAATTWS